MRDQSLSVIDENYENNGTFIFWQGTQFILQLCTKNHKWFAGMESKDMEGVEK